MDEIRTEHIPIVRPSWDEYFLKIAKDVSLRSHDAQTKHGCVIVNRKNRPLGFGYNGFPHAMDDTTLPNVRPAKYLWMIHSEVNAVTNCTKKPKKATAYVTGEPCNNCLIHLWENGVQKVVYIDGHGSFLLNEETRGQRETFIRQTGMILVPYKGEI